MDAKEASKLEKGQRVMWDGDKDDLGTVVEHSLAKISLWIKWDDLLLAGGMIDYKDMQRVEKAKDNGGK